MTPSRLLIPALLLAAAMAMAQMSRPPANLQGSNPPAGAQNANSQPQQPPQQQQPQPSNTNPKARRPPSAKTKPEYDAYLAAASTDAAKAEGLAREFEVQFPNSELLPFLYQQVMGKYQKADNGDKTLDMGRKVLQYDPDNIGALVMSATVLAERTRTSDIDRDQRLNEVTTYAQRAIDNIRTGNYMLAPNATPEQVQQFKDQVTSMAYQALGKAEMERENYPAAELNLRKATEGPGKGDAIVWYRLALALDHQSKYPDATGAITTAVALAPADSTVANMARSEQSRLKQLMAGGAAPNSAPKADQPEPELVPHK
jgi:tetratricopeptide (TPR) repeat protein